MAGSRPALSQAASSAARLSGGLLGGSPGVPLVRLARGDAEHPRAAGADQDRQRRLDRLGVAGGVGEVVELAVEGGRVRRQHRPDDRDRLLEPAHPPARALELDAVGVVLVDLPARPEAEDHPAAGEPVDGGRALGEQGWVVDRGGRDERPYPDPFGDRRQGGQQPPALVRVAPRGRRVPGVGHVVVGQPDAVPACGLGVAHLVKELGGRTVVIGPKRELHSPHPRDTPPGPAARALRRRVPRAAPVVSGRAGARAAGVVLSGRGRRVEPGQVACVGRGDGGGCLTSMPIS